RQCCTGQLKMINGMLSNGWWNIALMLMLKVNMARRYCTGQLKGINGMSFNGCWNMALMLILKAMMARRCCTGQLKGINGISSNGWWNMALMLMLKTLILTIQMEMCHYNKKNGTNLLPRSRLKFRLIEYAK